MLGRFSKDAWGSGSIIPRISWERFRFTSRKNKIRKKKYVDEESWRERQEEEWEKEIEGKIEENIWMNWWKEKVKRAIRWTKKRRWTEMKDVEVKTEKL